MMMAVAVVMMISTLGRECSREREKSAKENKSKGYTKYRDLKTQQQKYLSEEEEAAEGTSGEEDEDDDDDRGDGEVDAIHLRRELILKEGQARVPQSTGRQRAEQQQTADNNRHVCSARCLPVD